MFWSRAEGDIILTFPYFNQQFEKKGFQVLFMYGQLDETLDDTRTTNSSSLRVMTSSLTGVKAKNKVDDAHSDTNTQGYGLTSRQPKHFVDVANKSLFECGCYK